MKWHILMKAVLVFSPSVLKHVSARFYGESLRAWLRRQMSSGKKDLIAEQKEELVAVNTANVCNRQIVET